MLIHIQPRPCDDTRYKYGFNHLGVALFKLFIWEGILPDILSQIYDVIKLNVPFARTQISVIYLFSIRCSFSMSLFDLNIALSFFVQALRDIRNFPAPFWLICVMVGTYYCFLNGLISNGR